MVNIENINNLKIIEYTTTTLWDRNSWKIWVSKRINPVKEFYNYWQSPGGHVEESDISIRHAAQREVLEETGIHLPIESIHYWRTEHYFREKEWRIVRCFRANTYEIPMLMEPLEMTDWELKDPKQLLIEENIIDSLRDNLLHKNQTETTVILIEGTCGAGKSTFTKILEEYFKRRNYEVKVLDESFILQDPLKQLEIFAKTLQEYKKGQSNESKRSMNKMAVKLETWIRDNWMKQIYECFTLEINYDVIIMDRNLFSTEIFMKNMIKEGFLQERDRLEISKNYKQWNFFLRDASVIWWNTPLSENINRLQKRNRSEEKDLEYFKQLHHTYRKWMTRTYRNINIITKETLIPIEQIKEFIPGIINEEEIYRKVQFLNNI